MSGRDQKRIKRPLRTAEILRVGQQRRANCTKCDKLFSYEPVTVSGQEFFANVDHLCAVCDAAKERERAHAAAKQKLQRLELRWQNLCPPLYRATDSAHPAINQEVLRALIAWTPDGDGRGIGIYGETGRCKTRLMFLLLKKLLFEGHHVEAISTAKFAQICARLFDDSSEVKTEARRRLDCLQRCEVLFLDDLGKGPLTPRVEAELFELVETRTAHLRPILWTANATSAELVRIMSKDRGRPIIRRLKERSQLIAL